MGDAGAGVGIGEALDLGAEGEVFADPHVIVKRDVFRHVADAFAGFDRLAENIEISDFGGAAGGGQEAGEHAQRGGLPGAVRAEESDDLTPRNGEGDIADGEVAAVFLGKVVNYDHFCLWLA